MEFVDFDASDARQPREAYLFAAQALDAAAEQADRAGMKDVRDGVSSRLF